MGFFSDLGVVTGIIAIFIIIIFVGLIPGIIFASILALLGFITWWSLTFWLIVIFITIFLGAMGGTKVVYRT